MIEVGYAIDFVRIMLTKAHVQGGSVAERQFFSLSIKRSISIETEDNLSPETEPY